MLEFINNLVANLIFIFERLNWLSVVDILLVTAVFFGILQFLRGTQAFILLRGILLLISLVGILTLLEVLPAFSRLVRTTLSAILFAIPVIFAPEIRHALERLGRAGVSQPDERTSAQMQDTIASVVSSAVRLSDRQHGALIVLQRRDNLEENIQTGVRLDARVNAQLLLQVFYPNTPLHDGAVVISGRRLVAAACVMPLSARGVLAHSADLIQAGGFQRTLHYQRAVRGRRDFRIYARRRDELPQPTERFGNRLLGGQPPSRRVAGDREGALPARIRLEG